MRREVPLRVQGFWLAIVFVNQLLTPSGCETIGCVFEANNTCDWKNDIFMDNQLSWELTLTRSILATGARSMNALFVPVNHDTPPVSLAYLKNAAANVPGGQAYCLSFDYVMTDPNIGWLTVWYYWLNNGQFYNRQIWTNTAEEGTGQWQTGQMLLDGEGDWTIIFEVIANPFGIEIAADPVTGRGIGLDNIKQQAVSSASGCTIFVEATTTAAPQTTVAMTAADPTTVAQTVASTLPTTTPRPTTNQPTNPPSPNVQLVRIQLGEFRYTPNSEACDDLNHCDLRFKIQYSWISEGSGEHSFSEVIPYIANQNHIVFSRTHDVGLVRKGSVIRVVVDAEDDDEWFQGAHDQIAYFTFQFVVPYSAAEPKTLRIRDIRSTWYSDMDITFTVVA